jgi:hypothetical protein
VTEAVLLVGGRVFTGRRYAEALLVEGPRVVAVGTEAQTRREAPTGADRIDLGSNLVVPGLADAHLHLGELTREREALDLGPMRSISALQEHLRQRAEERPRGPLVGRGLDLETLAERRWPTVAELDAAVADRPVVLQHASGHAAVANTAALERAYGPAYGDRAEGPRNGVAVEEELDALGPVVREGLPLTPEAVERTMRELAALGLTAVGTMNTGEEELAILRQLDGDGRLPFRVRAYPPLGRAPEVALLRERQGSQLRVVGVKAFLDGAFGPRTASIRGPYADDPSTEGIDRGDDASLSGALDEACRLGLGPALHAIGDRAVQRAARLLSGRQAERSPPRIEHASLTPPPVLEALRRAGTHLVVQPGFVASDVWLSARLGPERARWAYAFRTLSNLGMPLAGSSDAPYDGADPWRGMRAAVRRQDDLGRSANPWPDQALTEVEALTLYGQGAHGALGDPGRGQLEPGATADFVVLSVRRLGDAVRLGGSAVRETWARGRPLLPGGHG